MRRATRFLPPEHYWKVSISTVVVTVDAMHTRTDTATLIPEGGGDYVFTVKANMPDTRATVTGKNKKKTVDGVYLITSADHVAAPPAVLAAWVQGHWGIENTLHWLRDGAVGEDLSQVRTAHAPV